MDDDDKKSNTPALDLFMGLLGITSLEDIVRATNPRMGRFNDVSEDDNMVSFSFHPPAPAEHIGIDGLDAPSPEEERRYNEKAEKYADAMMDLIERERLNPQNIDSTLESRWSQRLTPEFMASLPSDFIGMDYPYDEMEDDGVSEKDEYWTLSRKNLKTLKKENYVLMAQMRKLWETDPNFCRAVLCLEEDGVETFEQFIETYISGE